MLTKDQARALTNEIKQTTEKLAELFLKAKEERAWEALGYESWRLYISTEFNMSERRAYKILDLGEIIRSLSEIGVLPHGAIDHEVLPNERQARELAKIKRQNGPERMTEVWNETVKQTNGRPTAKAIRQTEASMEVCAPVQAKRVPTPFGYFRDEIVKILEEISIEHELTPVQATALAKIYDALDEFVDLATPEDQKHYDEMNDK